MHFRARKNETLTKGTMPQREGIAAIQMRCRSRFFTSSPSRDLTRTLSDYSPPRPLVYSSELPLFDCVSDFELSNPAFLDLLTRL